MFYLATIDVVFHLAMITSNAVCYDISWTWRVNAPYDNTAFKLDILMVYLKFFLVNAKLFIVHY